MGQLFALLSDIHGNLEALEAVLADIKKERPDKIVVLGDTIGYGPNPRECLEKVFAIADIVLIGNHEYDAITNEDDAMSEEAREVLQWTVKELLNCRPWKKLQKLVKKYGAQMGTKVIERVLCVHGSPKYPIEQYVWPGHEGFYICFNRQLDKHLVEIMGQFSQMHCFCGHTHVPALLIEYQHQKIFEEVIHWNTKYTFIGPNTIFFVPDRAVTISQLEAKKAIINPGSVGQPRDENHLASYALYNGEMVMFKRICYDWERTSAKIMKMPIKKSVKEFNAQRIGKGI